MVDRSSSPSRAAAPQIWAGIECTVNRVGDRTFDQLTRSGHDRRDDDLDRIAALGVAAVRYPAIWERTAPERLADADWSFLDARLPGLRDRGVRPIATLVHHGSGPRWTSLVEDSFADGLAAYARAVAERFPWLDAYTPVNEPNTTARFSALYGHWYPHHRDLRSFVRALMIECKASILAMRALREVNPAARFVLTEDLGYTRAAPVLQYQADHENERRWLSIDLLCGRVVPGHALFPLLVGIGVPEAELAWFVEHPCPPDVLGFNYYVTSERYLDDRLGRWPAHTHGGNGRHRYADVEACISCGMVGLEPQLRAAWARFGIPLAITEAHLGCTREEQLRWLHQLHAATVRVTAEGIPVEAFTAWSMFGAFDWDRLVTRDAGIYEPGLFDVRGPVPRPTALAALVRALATGQAFDHPVLAGRPWWQRRAILGEARDEVAA